MASPPYYRKKALFERTIFHLRSFYAMILFEVALIMWRKRGKKKKIDEIRNQSGEKKGKKSCCNRESIYGPPASLSLALPTELLVHTYVIWNNRWNINLGYFPWQVVQVILRDARHSTFFKFHAMNLGHLGYFQNSPYNFDETFLASSSCSKKQIKQSKIRFWPIFKIDFFRFYGFLVVFMLE